MEDLIGRLPSGDRLRWDSASESIAGGRSRTPCPPLAIIGETGYATFVLSHAVREGSSRGQSDEGAALRLAGATAPRGRVRIAFRGAKAQKEGCVSMQKGQRLGNYHLLDLLGRGDFAEVYLGLHVYLSTPAAIKVLHTRLTAQDQQRFLAEARMIARLDHPNIVRVLDFGVEASTPFLVGTPIPPDFYQYLPESSSARTSASMKQ